LCIGFVSVPLSGQLLSTKAGRVRYKAEAAPLPHAIIRINGMGTYADADGSFTLQVPRAERYRVQVEQLGCQTWERWLVAVPAGGLAIQMEPAPLLIEEIVMTDRSGTAAPQSEHYNT
jgi:hypothetical protein